MRTFILSTAIASANWSIPLAMHANELHDPIEIVRDDGKKLGE